MKTPARKILAEATAKTNAASQRAIAAEKSLKQTRVRYKAARKALKRARKSAKKFVKAARKAQRELEDLQRKAARAAKSKRAVVRKKAQTTKRKRPKPVIAKRVIPEAETIVSDSPSAA